MADIAFVVDSTADLPDSVRACPEIRAVPLRINWGAETFRDRVDLTTADFYGRLRTSATPPSTSAPPPGDFEELYQELLTDYAGIVSFHLPANLSGTYSAAMAAAQRIDPNRIRVLEAGHISLGVGWLVERALQIGQTTEDLDAIVEAARSVIPRVRLFAALDTLEWLQRGGRIGRVAALAGALLNVKPLLQIRDGQVLPLERARSRGNALRRLKELTLELGPLERLAVIEGDAAEAADDLSGQLAEHYPDVTIERGEVSPVVGVHAGPGVVAITCIIAAP